MSSWGSKQPAGASGLVGLGVCAVRDVGPCDHVSVFGCLIDSDTKVLFPSELAWPITDGRHVNHWVLSLRRKLLREGASMYMFGDRSRPVEVAFFPETRVGATVVPRCWPRQLPYPHHETVSTRTRGQVPRHPSTIAGSRGAGDVELMSDTHGTSAGDVKLSFCVAASPGSTVYGTAQCTLSDLRLLKLGGRSHGI